MNDENNQIWKNKNWIGIKKFEKKLNLENKLLQILQTS